MFVGVLWVGEWWGRVVGVGEGGVYQYCVIQNP